MNPPSSQMANRVLDTVPLPNKNFKHCKGQDVIICNLNESHIYETLTTLCFCTRFITSLFVWFTHMDFHVLLQNCLVSKPRITDRTLEWPLSGVSLLMYLQVTRSGKRFRTMLTFIRSFSSMLTNVFFQTRAVIGG